MKLKEKVKRILFALEQEKVKDYEQIIFNKRKFEELLKEYPYWEYVINSHCCNGWKECCWQDPYGEGIWDMDNDDVIKNIKRVISDKNYKKNYNKIKGRGRINKKVDANLYERVEVFVTFRDCKGMNCVDYWFVGFKDKKGAELSCF